MTHETCILCHGRGTKRKAHGIYKPSKPPDSQRREMCGDDGGIERQRLQAIRATRDRSTVVTVKPKRQWNQPQRSTRTPEPAPTPEQLAEMRQLIADVEREVAAAKKG